MKHYIALKYIICINGSVYVCGTCWEESTQRAEEEKFAAFESCVFEIDAHRCR